MKYFYGQFDGHEFPTGEKLFGFDKLLQFILEHGQQALTALEQMMREPEENRYTQLIQQLLEDGILQKDSQGRLMLTGRAVGRMQRRMLLEVFAGLRSGQREGHERVTTGQGGQRIEGTKPYQYGDNVSELDLHQTLRNALSRHGLPERRDGKMSRIIFGERDLELHLHEGTASCSTVVLLDMSGSMMRYGRFVAAKKVALAMAALVRGAFPQDSLDFVGFYSGASRISEAQVPLLMPMPVTIYDSQVRLRVPIDRLDEAPQHFTNLHMGLQIARQILKRRGAENKQLFIITDGQPTAHVEGSSVLLLYPPHPSSTVATLKEAHLAVRDGCRVATFALIEDYWGMDWVDFVDQLTKLTRGTAFYTNSAQLASCVMESYLSGRKRKSYIA